MKKLFSYLIILFSLSFFTFGQEALKSTEEEYYDFLSLSGIVTPPTLGYRTLSDSVWELPEDTSHVWQNNNLGTKKVLWEAENQFDNFFFDGINQNITLKFYGPEWYNSYNTLAPYGQNDGALWQGRGYNTSISTGARLEAYGFELTLKPNFNFSQNLDFELMDNSQFYSNKYAYIWGYGGDIGADAPQRFGDKAFTAFDWGDSEIRWSWHSFTIGYGTQSPWIGPAWLNSLLHSNNAPSYPKLDFGLRKTNVRIPFLDWNLGDIETRLWVGKTTESDFFDSNDENDHNYISGWSFYYAPSFLPGLSLGFTKVCLIKTTTDNYLKYFNPLYDTNYNEDQKMSISFNWILPKAGFDFYGELGIDDYIVGYHHDMPLLSAIRNPFHTMTYTFGFKKSLVLSEKKNLYGELLFEWNNTEMSQDFQFEWPYNFGFHHNITQGYTNKGQWLGSGYGYGGNSQILEFNIIYPKGNTLLFIWRNNPDNNFIYKQTITTSSSDAEVYHRYYVAYKANFNIGINTNYYVTKDLSIFSGLVYNMIINPYYNPKKPNEEEEYYMDPVLYHNFQIQLRIKYSI